MPGLLLGRSYFQGNTVNSTATKNRLLLTISVLAYSTVLGKKVTIYIFLNRK